jgi:hypothetical protein
MTHAADLDGTAEAAPALVETETVSFEDLVLARDRARGYPRDDAIRDEYRYKRARFEHARGPIVQEWWSDEVPAGAVLTVKPTPWFRTAVGAQTGAQFHRSTDRATTLYPQVAAALTKGDGLAIRCREILRGSAQQVALVHIFGGATSLLGVVELVRHELHMAREAGTAELANDPEAASEGALSRALGEYWQALSSADAYYRQAAARATQIFYFWGMIVGLLAIAALTTGVAVLVDFLLGRNGISVDSNTFALMLTAVSAGGVGACVSAMWRISSGTFQADYEAGSTHARTIGSFRPFIGAAFGLGLYIALRAGFLPTLQTKATDFYLAALIAFLGGFSERLAPDVFAKAEQRVGEATDERR